MRVMQLYRIGVKPSSGTERVAAVTSIKLMSTLDMVSRSFGQPRRRVCTLFIVACWAPAVSILRTYAWRFRF